MNHTDVISRNKDNETTRLWSSRELAVLRDNAYLGAEGVADLLERSVGSVKLQAHRQRVSLRQPGSRSGLMLGQPRGVSFADDARMQRIRSDALNGFIDIGRVVRRAEAAAHGVDLCPQCAKNPIEVESSGVCTACHKRNLAFNHANETDELEAQRELDRERQRKHRRKRKAG